MEHESVMCLFDGPAGSAPKTFAVLPWGNVRTSKGALVVDDQAASAIVAAFRDRGNDIPVDYEHQTQGGTYSREDGKAPAAGWIKDLWVEAGKGIIALCEWTDEGKLDLESKKYRYFSPVVLFDKKDRRVHDISSVALTNKPAIRDLRPLVAKDDETVSLAEFSSLQERCDQLELRERAREGEAMLKQALSEGKLLKFQVPWAQRLILKDKQLFQEWAGSAPVVLQQGRTEPPLPTGLPGGKRLEAIREACREFEQNKARLCCSQAAYVNAVLAESMESPLSEQENKALEKLVL